MQNRIRKLREEKRMTQVRLSVELGVSQETISAYELGKHYPSVDALKKMAELFSVSTDYILGISDQRLSDVWQPSEEEAAAHSLFGQLSDRQKERVISFMLGMLEGS